MLALVAGVALSTAVVLDAGPAAASPSVKADATAGTNGDVLAIAQAGSRIYVGGSFSWAGPFTGSGVAVRDTDGRRNTASGRVNGPVRAVAADGSGGWYIGGDFTFAGGLPRNGLARVLASGAVSPWNPGTDGSVRAIAVAGGKVYVGGSFTTVGGQARRNLAAVDAASGVPAAWSPDPNAPISSLAFGDNRLFVGGSFTSIGGQGRSGLAALSPDSGLADGWDPGANGPVNALALTADAARVYVGGGFTAAGAQARANLAAVDTATGLAVSWNPGSDGPVYALALSTDQVRVYAGGSFATAGGQPRANLAALDAGSGLASGWSPAPNGPVNALAPSGDGARLYAGGSFSAAGGQARSNAAALDTSTGAADGWDPRTEDSVNVVAPSGSQVFVGGAFKMLNGYARGNVAAIDSTTGEVDPGWNPQANNVVRALAPSSDGARIFLGGAFTKVGGVGRSRLAAVDAVTGALTGWKPAASSAVRTLAVGGNRVYAGGNFATVSGVASARLAAIDATSGAVDAAFAPLPDAEVRALVITSDASTLYAVGFFKNIGGLARPGAAALVPGSGAVTGFTPSSGGAAIAAALSPDGSRLYFSTTSNRTFAYNPAAGNAPVWSLHTGGDVQAIAASATEVYVGGHFTNIPDAKVDRLHLASVTASTAAVTAWNPSPDGAYGVWSLAVAPSALLSGGDFEKVGGKAQPHFARFSGTP